MKTRRSDEREVRTEKTRRKRKRKRKRKRRSEDFRKTA